MGVRPSGLVGYLLPDESKLLGNLLHGGQGKGVQLSPDLPTHQAGEEGQGKLKIPIQEGFRTPVQVLEDSEHQISVIQEARQAHGHLGDQVHGPEEIPFGMLQDRLDRPNCLPVEG